jgi:hypothetical protein
MSQVQVTKAPISVGCERADGTVSVHLETEYCDVCADLAPPDKPQASKLAEALAALGEIKDKLDAQAEPLGYTEHLQDLSRYIPLLVAGLEEAQDELQFANDLLVVDRRLAGEAELRERQAIARAEAAERELAEYKTELRATEARVIEGLSRARRSEAEVARLRVELATQATPTSGFRNASAYDLDAIAKRRRMQK